MTKKSASALDVGVSLLAGGSAAFLLYAMPEELLARAFAAVRLASFSPHFQPPFGMGLRCGVAVVVGLVAFAFVWSLMKALDRPAAAAPSRKPEPAHHADAEPEAPHLRKADAHPDAPARRPLLAGRDLGEPLDLDGPLDLAGMEPLDAAADSVDAIADAIDAEPETAAKPQPEPPLAAEPEPTAEQEPLVAERAEPLPSFLVAQEPEPESVEEPQPVAAPTPAAEDQESIVSLMQRFESGLGRKKQALADRVPANPVPVPAAPAAADSGVAAPAPVGHRLRSAIADLQRVAGR